MYDKRAIVTYIQSMAGELADLADKNMLHDLEYMLRVAEKVAERQAMQESGQLNGTSIHIPKAYSDLQ